MVCCRDGALGGGSSGGIGMGVVVVVGGSGGGPSVVVVVGLGVPVFPCLHTLLWCLQCNVPVLCVCVCMCSILSAILDYVIRSKELFASRPAVLAKVNSTHRADSRQSIYTRDTRIQSTDYIAVRCLLCICIACAQL